MAVLWQYFLLCAPLFGIVFGGYALAKLPVWRERWTQIALKIVFATLLPALLFHKLSDVASLPPVDARLLLAFFGGCFIVFGIGRLVAFGVFRLDGAGQSVFALGGIFSNNVLLGLPLVRSTLGAAALPATALVIVFNSFTFWTLVSVSVEWAKHGSISKQGFTRTAKGVLTNPIVMSVLAGTAFSYSGWHLPEAVENVLVVLATIAGPAALIVLGMGLALHGMRSGLRESLAIASLKLFVQPFVVWLLARALALPTMETKVVVLLASLSVGANVYLMATQFERLEAAVATSLVLSTLVAAFTTPLLLWMLGSA
jgi:malonate transporter and related proteins